MSDGSAQMADLLSLSHRSQTIGVAILRNAISGQCRLGTPNPRLRNSCTTENDVFSSIGFVQMDQLDFERENPIFDVLRRGLGAWQQQFSSRMLTLEM